VVRDGRRREESGELDPAVAVRRAHHGNLDALIAQYLAKDFGVLAGRQAEALGLIENRWPVIRALLDQRPRS